MKRKSEECDLLKSQLADKTKELTLFESKLKHAEKLRQDAEHELASKRMSAVLDSADATFLKPGFASKLADPSSDTAHSLKPTQTKLQPTGLTALNVDTKKTSLALSKNNTNLTERTAGSSSHLKEEYSRLHGEGSSHLKKAIEMYGMKDLKKQIGRSATPYIQEIHKKSIQKSDSVQLQGAAKSHRNLTNQTIASQAGTHKNMSHLRSKSHSTTILLAIPNFIK